MPAPIHLAVDGMTCAACVSRVEKALGSIAGVKTVSVSLASHSARIEGQASPHALIEAVENAGYDAKLLKTNRDSENSGRAIRREQQARFAALAGLLLCLPFLVSMGVMAFGGHPLLSPAQEALLASLLQFGLGMRFYKGAFKALRGGAASMDVIYCSVSFTGFSHFFQHPMVKAAMQVASFVFLLFLGFKFLLASTVKTPTRLDVAADKLEAKIEQKIHSHSAFATGFLRVAANLGVFGAWLVLAATLLAHDWVDDTLAAKAGCVAGVFTGTVLWFLILSFVVSRGHGRFSEKTLLRLQHVSGLCLITAAIIEGVQIAWHLAQHKI